MEGGRAASQLPREIREKLAQLELELSEGDITRKGYEKKRGQLLAMVGGGGAEGSSSPSTRAHRRHQRRLTRQDQRYHSEIRAEAVQQALSQSRDAQRPAILQPVKRHKDVAHKAARSKRRSALSDSSSDEDAESLNSHSQPPGPSQSRRPEPFTRTAAGETTFPVILPSAPPDVAKVTAKVTTALPQTCPTPVPQDVVYANAEASLPPALIGVDVNKKQAKVSLKIQQLLHTLQRPKRKPLHEFYNDDDAELEAMAKAVDPLAPKAEGAIMTPARGESVNVPTQAPRSMEAALNRHASQSPKATAAMVLDASGRPSSPLSYTKLLSRTHKLAYQLLVKTGLKAGDRVALVYPNTEPLGFLVGFHACVSAGLVGVGVEVPTSRRDAALTELGFLLRSCDVSLALTSEACLKGLPKDPSGAVAQLKGWPRLTWLTSDSPSKPPKDWAPPSILTDDSVAYVEYSSEKDGSIKGVKVTRAAMLNHVRALVTSCGYAQGQLMLCLLDFKREVGLWHGILASVFAGVTVVFVSYSLMKMNPGSWMLNATRLKASVAVVKSRDLHWGLLASKDHSELDLSSLKLVVVADGANPWSLSSCDQFVATFAERGLKPEVVCPCAGSSETGTVSIRRAGRTGSGSSGRGILSMGALSHGVVRVDTENSLTSLTLQDAGQVVAGAVAVVVARQGPPKLCKADEIGEICLHSNSTGSGYWGLEGKTAAAFRVDPLGADDRPMGAVEYVRSGLMGFLGPGGLVFVCGNRCGLMQVSGRLHSADDLIATVLAVEPMKFIYRGRIAAFAVSVLRDERICLVAEQKPDVSEEESFNWMSRVLQAVDSIHQVAVYCLALVPANSLPKTPLGGIHVSETKSRFLQGNLHPTNLLMCPHTSITNLPKPREPQPDVGPAAIFVGNIVQGVRMASAKGRPLPDEAQQPYLLELLVQRAASSPDHQLLSLVSARGSLSSKGPQTQSLTCQQLLKRAERVGSLLLEKARLSPGDHVALIFPPSLDLVVAFFGCLYVGCVPVCIRPPHSQNLSQTLPTVRMIVDVSRAVGIISTHGLIKLLRSKEAGDRLDPNAWPAMLDVDEVPRRKAPPPLHRPDSPTQLAYLDFSVSTTGMLAGIRQSHASTLALCRSLKLAQELYPSRHVCLALDPYSGLGFVLWCLSSVFAGHHSILIPPSEVEQSPGLWLSSVSQHKVRDTFCSYGVMELCVRELGESVGELGEKGVGLSCVRTLAVVAEERPRVALCAAFCALFSPLGLNPRVVSTSFGSRVNVALCMQGASSPAPTTLYVDARALRHDRVTLVEKGAPHSLPLTESGKLLPGTRVVIANPDTLGQCADSHLGEIWVAGPGNAAGFFGDEAGSSAGFGARLSTGDTRSVWARTGYLGFLRQTGAVTADGELHDAVFVVGALDETLLLRGCRFHPSDIENTILRAHGKMAECAVFTWTNLVVGVVELGGAESEALDLVPLVTSAVLEEQHLVLGVVVVVDPGTVPINSRGEKQRMHLRDAFLHDQLDPIYVAYNM